MDLVLLAKELLVLGEGHLVLEEGVTVSGTNP